MSDQLADALDCLRQEQFDAVLLNLSLPDSPALLDTFVEANAMCRGAPIVVLADEEDENLANCLLRRRRPGCSVEVGAGVWSAGAFHPLCG